MLSLVEIVIQKKADFVGFRMDVNFGETNDNIQSSAAGSLSNLQQVYLTAIIPIGSGLIVDAGKFVTHMGYEVIESKDNWNYSRSSLFAYAIPYFHIGVRSSYSISNDLIVCAHIYNGWNNASAVHRGKTLGTSITYSPLKGVSLTANYLGGYEQPDSIGAERRDIYDFYCTVQITARLLFALNMDHGSEPLPSGATHWKGIALYGRYILNDAFALAVRGEMYADPEGATTGTAQNLAGVTLTYDYRAGNNFLLRGEVRHDASTAHVFDNEIGARKIGYQNTITLAAIVMF